MADKQYSSPSHVNFWTKTTFLPPLQALLIWQSLSLFWFCGLLAARYPIAGMCVATLIFFLDVRLRHKCRAGIAIFLFFIGFLAIHLLVDPRPNYPTWALEDGRAKLTRLEGTVSKVESLTDKRLRIYLHNTYSLDNPDHILPGILIWTHEAKNLNPKHEQLELPIRPLPGQRVQISARIRSTEGFSNWGISDFGFYWQSKGVFWRIWSRGDFGDPQIIGNPNAFAMVRHNLLKNLEQTLFTPQLNLNSIKAQAYAFLPALLFGEKYYINPSTMENMRAASLVHSLALSGQHLAIVGLCAAVLASLIYMIYPRALLILPYRKWLGIFALPLALLYLWIGNAPASLIRAALMLFLALIFYWRARLATLVDILLLTLLLITCYDPLAIFNIGLQLSVLCVGSIALVLPLLRNIPKPHSSLRKHSLLQFYMARCGRSILQIFIISLSIQLVLAPVFLYYFQPTGPWFMSNVFWLPILSLWVLPLAVLGMMCMQLGFVSLSENLLHLSSLPCEVLLQVLDVMRAQGLFDFPALLRPHWTVYLAWATLFIALALLVGRISFKSFLQSKNLKELNHNTHKHLLLLAMCLLLMGPVLRYAQYWYVDANVEMLDVGQGQAVCITLHGGERVLVDGGGSMSKHFDTGADLVIPSLVYNKPPRLWAVIASHPDMDHMRGLMAVLEHMQVGTFYHNGKKMSEFNIRKLKALKDRNKLPPTKVMHRGMLISLPSVDDRFKLEVLNPPVKQRLSKNNASIVLRFMHEKNNIKKGIALLCGDAEIFAQKNILKYYSDLSVSVFVLPHHGSKDALWQPFYNAVKADVALVSSGNYNKFSFPHLEVQKKLQKHNIPLYNTGKSGAISINWQDNKQNLKQKNKALLSIKTRKTATELFSPQVFHTDNNLTIW